MASACGGMRTLHIVWDERTTMKRRTFLQSGAGALAPAVASAGSETTATVDFRYAPKAWQSTICFPDDHSKSLVGEKGDLRYGFDRRKRITHFPQVVQFSLRGMETDQVGQQWLEDPGIPIIHTRIDRPEAFLELTAFATNRAGEGRVDNVIVDVRPRSKREVWVNPVVVLNTRQPAALKNTANGAAVHLGGESAPPFLVSDCPLRASDTGHGYIYAAPERPARSQEPLRCFFRFPQEGQDAAKLEAGLRDAGGLLEESRQFWHNWRPSQGPVGFELPRVYQNFLTACARNILQAREQVDGKLTFQVGPTTYRGLWVVDGNFILEAARYLGYDAEAQQGLETTWGMQRPDGSVVAAVETAHWKDTGIAMFSMVRQAELARDWSYFQKMQPEWLRAVRFLSANRDQARREGSANGKYGLLAKGFGDGGIGGGLREELTNTLWALAGLRATVEAAERLRLSGAEAAREFYSQLRQAFFAAARGQMRRHPDGFDFLPMLLKEDPGWTDPDEWKRPRPQTGQWALAHSLYPGLVFEQDDPVVKGYLALMRSCTKEDVPVETGWLPHEGLWNYDACFAAHAFLWARDLQGAMSIFTGFLNHATPLYCWREEQPLQGAMIGNYVGDMPHNWASAECVLFLRHMLALEDGADLRLLAGIGEAELAAGEPYRVAGSPTRFGRVSLKLEPEGRGRCWHLEFRRGDGPQPRAVELPEAFGTRYRFSELKGAGHKRDSGRVAVDPVATSWEATWVRT